MLKFSPWFTAFCVPGRRGEHGAGTICRRKPGPIMNFDVQFLNPSGTTFYAAANNNRHWYHCYEL